MARLTGVVRAASDPAAHAYVQVRSLAGDFQGEVRADDGGRFVLYPSEGRWRLVSWLPGGGRTEREIEVGRDDLEVELTLG